MYFAIEGGKQSASDTVKLFKASDHAIKYVRVFADAGTPQDITGTLTLEVYSDTTRATSVKSLTLTAVTAAAGIASITAAVANVDFGPGKYVAYVKLNNSGAISISKNYVTLTVG